MTREELISIGRHKVRSDESLMLFYLQEFEKLFNRKPNCAACSFQSDWKRFESGKKQQQKNITMKTDKTFQLTTTAKYVIHTYKNGKRPLRKYGYNMTEVFANEYLSNGTKEEIEERKKHFKILPKTETTKVEAKKDATFIILDGEQINIEDATGKLMDAYAKQEGIDFGDAKKVADKRDVIRKVL